ncbi:rCG58235 [Rattus norvegicus]|uniref:RCG58235 n=1 Tax=Rattus norvegicus TaxID=10116 RepID=A6J5B0_RAT|nr:rCG58235 [Rattus norvegicus]
MGRTAGVQGPCSSQGSRFWGSNLYPKAWWQAPLPPEPPHRACIGFLKRQVTQPSSEYVSCASVEFHIYSNESETGSTSRHWQRGGEGGCTHNGLEPEAGVQRVPFY